MSAVGTRTFPRQKGVQHLDRTSSLTRQVYDAVLEDIIEGAYQQTEVINEKQLIEKYGVSKSPVRDALSRLCSENVLRSIPRYGYAIVKITEREIRDILEFRSILEGNSLRHCLPQLSAQDLQELMDYTLEHCRVDYEQDIWNHWDNNIRFHLKLISYSRNQYSYQMLQQSINVLTRAYAQFYWDKWKRTSFVMDCEGHIRIVQAMMAGDVEGSVQELLNDISSFNGLLFK